MNMVPVEIRALYFMHLKWPSSFPTKDYALASYISEIIKIYKSSSGMFPTSDPIDKEIKKLALYFASTKIQILASDVEEWKVQ